MNTQMKIFMGLLKCGRLGWKRCYMMQVCNRQSSPFKPQYRHTNSPNWSLYITLKDELREFDKRSKHFLLGDHFINSHNLISWQCTDIIERKLMLVTIGTSRVKTFLVFSMWQFSYKMWKLNSSLPVSTFLSLFYSICQ